MTGSLGLALSKGFPAVREKKRDILVGAAKYDCMNMVEFLLENGADPGLPDHWNCNALAEAATGGHQEIIELLITRNVEIKLNNKIMSAAGGGHKNLVYYLVNNGAVIKKGGKYEKEAIEITMRGGHAEIVELLLEKVDKDYLVADYGIDILNGAAEDGHAGIAKAWLKKMWV